MTELWITLPADWVTGRELGRQRQAAYDRAGLSSGRLLAGDATWENILGAVAELALSRAIHVPMPPFWADIGTGDPGWDLPTVVGNIDVKGVGVSPWYLGVKDSTLAKQPGADFYALIWCPKDEPTCEFVGFATRAEIEAGTRCAHILDPKATGAWRKDPRKRAINPQPGRWLDALPEVLHDARVLLEGVARGVPASLWMCHACTMSAFSARGRACDLCGQQMVETSLSQLASR